MSRANGYGRRKVVAPARYDALGYHAAEVVRTSGDRIPLGGSADYHVRYDRRTLVAEGLRLDRDSTLFFAIADRSVDVLLGSGFVLQARTPDHGLNKAIEAAWKAWGKDPEVRGMFDWQDIERLVVNAELVQGDILGYMTSRGKLQLFESEQIGDAASEYGGLAAAESATRPGGRVEGGIELDSYGRPVAFRVAAFDQFGGYTSPQPGSWTALAAKDCVYYANLRRYSQTRGVPLMTAAMPMIARLTDVCDSEAISWQQLAKFALSVNRERGAELAYEESGADPLDPLRPPRATDRVEDFAEATIFHGEPGESVSAIPRDLPGKDFPESVRMYLRLIGMVVSLPLEVILVDFSRSNYTGSRAALEQTFRSYIARQRRLKRAWHEPIYRWWLSRQIKAGVFPSEADQPSIFAHEWQAPEFPWVDQLKEAEAWKIKLESGLASQTDALRSENTDRDDWLRTKEREIESAIEIADRLNRKHPGAAVDWRIFAGMPVSVNQAAQAAEREENGSESRDRGDEQPPADANGG